MKAIILEHHLWINYSAVKIIRNEGFDTTNNKNAEITRIAGLSGKTKIENIKTSLIKHDFVFNSIYDIYKSIK